MAVYTHISEEDLVKYLTLFDIGTLVSFTGITDGVENTNYRLITTKEDFILTLFEKRTKREDIPFYLSFMTHLHGKGIQSPDVITATSGQRVNDLQGKAAIITTFLPGSWPRDIRTPHAAAIGRMLARMHLAGQDFSLRRHNTMALQEWRDLIERCAQQPETIEPGLSAFLKGELSWQEKNWPQDLPSGAIHADLFPDNVFFTGDQITGIIDFYFSCTDLFVYDLMLTVNSWCFDVSGHLDLQKTSALLAAYQDLRPLTAPEKVSLSFFGRAAALRIIATRLYDWLHQVPGANVKPKDPLEYVRILKYYQKEGFTA